MPWIATVPKGRCIVMKKEKVQTEIAKQIQATLVLLAAALRAEAAKPGGPVARITLGRAADAVQAVVNGK
jgi:hypothetical protein